MDLVDREVPRGSWLTRPKVILLCVGAGAALVAKWYTASGRELPPWLLPLALVPVAVAQLLEVVGRFIRRRQGVPVEELGPVPTGGPPGWRWDPRRARWTPPEP